MTAEIKTEFIDFTNNAVELEQILSGNRVESKLRERNKPLFILLREDVLWMHKAYYSHAATATLLRRFNACHNQF